MSLELTIGGTFGGVISGCPLPLCVMAGTGKKGAAELKKLKIGHSLVLTSQLIRQLIGYLMNDQVVIQSRLGGSLCVMTVTGKQEGLLRPKQAGGGRS